MDEVKEMYYRMCEINGNLEAIGNEQELKLVNEYIDLYIKMLGTEDGRSFLKKEKTDIYMGLFPFLVPEEEIASSNIEGNTTLDRENLEIARKESATFFDEMINEYFNNIDINSGSSLKKGIHLLEQTLGLEPHEIRRKQTT